MITTVSESEPQEVKIQLLLAGGHQYTIYLKSDAPLLQLLAKTLLSKHQKNENSTLFQIPLAEGHSALCFPSEHLVGMVTEPPISLQNLQPQDTKNNLKNSTNTTPKINNLESHYLLIENFLSQSENKQLLNYVLQRKSDFSPTTTSTKAENYRRSLVLYSFPKFQELIVNRIKEIFPDVLNKLSIPVFSIAEIESQLTAHNNNNFYKIHNDNGSPDTATRVLTYVYYFYREPKAFTEGKLIIYDSKIQGKYYVKAQTFKSIEPTNNTIVFFLSRYMHEVLPVTCPSQDFADSRFTINGWIRRS
ncbi:Prolyl 4-hydroxylase, alpha subunit [Trichodesmium erythraeum IMS101]|uniref:Prolyl 4-hydroxylase, alpha subunit n=1 Tax=Trichodesmium erythraeum (strain IMS101) TaxID=203124 RepID=Q116T5_TRIEI|nr:2OG-Fe(II) oxygenase [Trichodesmium erythraeum GBRTRLIN201]